MWLQIIFYKLRAAGTLVQGYDSWRVFLNTFLFLLSKGIPKPLYK